GPPGPGRRAARGGGRRRRDGPRRAPGRCPVSESLATEPPDTADLGVEPWVLREATLDLAHLAQTESLFALSNGFLGLRGNLDEGEPSGVTGTYLAGFFEHHPLPYPEGGYGYPEAGQQLVDVTDGKI